MLGLREYAAAALAVLVAGAVGCGSDRPRGPGTRLDAGVADATAPVVDGGERDGGGGDAGAMDAGSRRDAAASDAGGGRADAGTDAGSCADADGDGFEDEACGGTDCADDDDDVHPGATEACNEVDDDCDGSVDEGLGTTYWPDTDGDGFGDGTATPTTACSMPAGWVPNDVDCSDEYAEVHPGATEVCNYIDDNCDGRVDEGTSRTIYYEDGDGDGYGGRTSVMGCPGYPPPGGSYTTTSTDCYDDNADAHPGQETFFTSDRGDGLYDYNCDSLHESAFPVSPGCTSTSTCSSGWNGSPPACGSSGSYLDCHVSGSSCVRYGRSYRNPCR